MEWERFARGIWPGTATDPATLRDHVEQVLHATVADMGSAQTSAQQSSKSQGDGAAGTASDGVVAASVQHGADRAASGFNLTEVIAEYRALRASVLRLWAESRPATHPNDLEDVTRFNESIDQSLTAAVGSYHAHHRECQETLIAAQAARLGAEEANRSKDVFLATLSHELRTPLNAIVGWLDVLGEPGCAAGDLTEGLAVINRNTKAQIRLVEDILDVSRIASGKLRLEMRQCRLDQIVEVSVATARAAAQARGIAIDLHVQPVPALVTCDPARLQQVLANLLFNAVKFTPPAGVINVSTAADDGVARVEIRDNGIGIRPDFLPRLFDRFSQADDGTRRRAGGLGLGLSIAKHIMELHDGTIDARSPGEGHGSTFTIRLPMPTLSTAAGYGEQSAVGQSARPTKVPAARLDGLRLLLVDDEPDTLQILGRLLRHRGAVVTLAGSAAAALVALGSAPVDVLVSDIGMPGQDGHDLLREVRRRGFAARDLPAIAVTAFVDKDDQRRALMAGFQVHIPKPVDLSHLATSIASLAGRTG